MNGGSEQSDVGRAGDRRPGVFNGSLTRGLPSVASAKEGDVL